MKGVLFTRSRWTEGFNEAAFIPDGSQCASDPDCKAPFTKEQGWSAGVVMDLLDYFPPMTWNIPRTEEGDIDPQELDRLIEKHSNPDGLILYSWPLM